MENKKTQKSGFGEAQRPLNSVLKFILNDERLSDVTLKGTDGVEIPANRAILTARSEIFEKMLLGDFSEATNNVVQVNYTGDVVRALVQFCYTDKADLLEQECKDCTSVVKLMALLQAADYFHLTELLQKTVVQALGIITVHPLLAFIFLHESKAGGLVAAKIQEHSLECIRQRAELLLKEDSGEVLACIHASVIETMLQDDEMVASEYTVFQILLKWANASMYVELEGQEVLRQDLARQYMSHVSLQDISAKHLVSTVAPSGLATSEQLNEAYRLQALEFCRVQDASRFDRVRSRFTPMVWKKSQKHVVDAYQSTETDTLDCAWMRPGGVYKWTVSVQSLACPLDQFRCAVGIASSPNLKFILGNDNGVSWAYHSNGTAMHKGDFVQTDLPTFDEGSIMTMLLDLTGTGVLAVWMAKQEFVVFRDFLTEENRTLGFLPAVSICGTQVGNSSSIRFGGFKTLNIIDSEMLKSWR